MKSNVSDASWLMGDHVVLKMPLLIFPNKQKKFCTAILIFMFINVLVVKITQTIKTEGFHKVC